MGQVIFIFAILILVSGLYVMLTSDNYFRKIIGLSIFQASVLVFYIALGKARDGIVPIDVCYGSEHCDYVFSSPLPHVLMLTAIVVGFATMSVGFALVIRIKKEYGSISEEEIVIKNGDKELL